MEGKGGKGTKSEIKTKRLNMRKLNKRGSKTTERQNRLRVYSH